MSALRSARIREAGVWAWCLGLGVLALDFLTLPIFEWRASAAYFFFALSFGLMSWAEKRAYGTRIFLYRLHDLLVYGPWRFLLLYFLWVSLFAPFTAAPMASVVYALNGWLSLFAVGVSAQFLFCERGAQGPVLVPKRLRLAFVIFCATVSLLFASALWQIVRPGEVGVPVGGRANLFLFFVMGLPFLLWDFVKAGRRLVPRALSLGTIWIGSVTLLLVGRKFYVASLMFCLGGVLGLFLYKRMRARHTWRLGLAALAMVGGVALLVYVFRTFLPWEAAIAQARREMEWRLLPAREAWLGTWEALRASRFMGAGVGVTGIRGVWTRVLAEAGVVGLALYSAFFVSILWQLYRVRHAPRVVVSNVALVSVGAFLLFLGHLVDNPYSAYVWVWYSIWALFASTPKKQKGTLG